VSAGIKHGPPQAPACDECVVSTGIEHGVA
jgi:hypothetical protein